MDDHRKDQTEDPRRMDRRTLANLLGIGVGGAAVALTSWPSEARADEPAGGFACATRCIEEFWRPKDGDMRDPNFNWLPLVMRAQSEWTDPIRGFTLNFGPRYHYFSGTIEITRSMHIVGSGGVGWYAGTRFGFPRGVTGIRCRLAWSIVERVALYGNTSITETYPDAHGVVMLGRMKLRDVYITGFGGNGVHIDASRPNNAIGWLIDQCRIDLCGGHGIYVHGTDAAAGCAIGVDVADCRGWGIWDDAELGNTYIACQVDNLTLPGQGAYRSTNPFAPNLFLNCYVEGSQRSEFQNPSMCIGGLASYAPFVGDGAVMSYGARGSATAATFNGVAGGNTLDPNNIVIAQLGSKDTGGVALELFTQDLNRYWLRYSPAGRRGWWEMVWAQRPDDAFPFRFSDGQATEGAGQFWMPNGYYIGPTAQRRAYTGLSEGPPTLGTWARGDRVLNIAPSSGGFAGWICVAAGTPGTWRGFGRIE